MREPGKDSSAEVEVEAADDDDVNAGVTISDDDPERARRIAQALAIDSDEAAPTV
jgi:hypothetical protein